MRGAAATITATFTDQDGEPANASGTVTVRVQNAAGTDVLAAGSSTTTGSTGEYRRALTAVQTADLDVLTATWTDGGDASTTVTVHEIAGAVYFTAAEARAADKAIDAKWTQAEVIAARRDVEDEFESICGVAFVPRYARARCSGRGTRQILLPDPKPRRLRSVWVYTDATTYTALTNAELAACHLDESGRITRTDGNWFPDGLENIVVEYEHGWDRPPAEIRRYAIKRLRQVLTESTSAVPSRATSFQVGDSGVFRLATAGKYTTGDPDIDGALARWSMRAPGIA